MFRVIVLCLFFASGLAKQRRTEIPHVDQVHRSLSAQQWGNDEVTCRSKIFNMLDSVKNSTLWATWAWDSNPQGTTGIFYGANMHLGNYDQCLKSPWQTNPGLRQQYCLAEIEMNKSKERTLENPGPYDKAKDYYLNVGGHTGRTFSYMAYGVCLPAGCPTKSAEKFVRALLNTGHLQAEDADVTIHHCDDDGSRLERPWSYYVYVLLLTSLAITAILSTYYVKEYPVTANTNTLVNYVAKSFDLRRNYDTVLKIDKNDVTSLHAVKFLMSVVTIYMHYIYNLQSMSVSNALDASLPTKFPESLFMAHADVYIEFFVAISGVVLGMCLRTMDVTTPVNLLKNLLKRYIRLIGPLVVSVFYLIYILIYEGNGPIYAKTTKLEQDTCEKNWWLSFLMVGNLFNVTEMCYVISWYIAMDFQFYVVTLVLLFIYRKNPRVGKMAAGIVLAIAFLGPAISTYVYDLPAVLLFRMLESPNIRHCKNFQYGHAQAYNRMLPYAVGLLVGYIMSVYKPADYKKVWSKKTSFFGALGFFSLMVAVLATGALCFRYGVRGPLAVIFSVFNRPVFAIGALGTIVFIIYGDLPVINLIFNWPGFTPLSRLSYGSFLIHFIFMWEITLIQRSHVTYSKVGSIVDTVGLSVASFGWSLLIWLIVEAPLINITNRYLTIKSNSKNIDKAPIEEHAGSSVPGSHKDE